MHDPNEYVFPRHIGKDSHKKKEKLDPKVVERILKPLNKKKKGKKTE